MLLYKGTALSFHANKDSLSPRPELEERGANRLTLKAHTLDAYRRLVRNTGQST